MTNEPSTSNQLDPADWASLKDLGKQMIEDMFDYLANVRARPVWQAVPQEVRERLRGPLPQDGSPPELVYREFLETILPYPRGNIHPRYWGWVNGSGVPVAMLADFLASAMNGTVGAGENSAIMVEEQVIEWMKSAFGWPDAGAGVLTSGCSMGQIIALAAARHARAGFNVRELGLRAGPELTIYGSVETHHSVAKAAELLGLGRSAVRLIPVGSDFRIDVEQLRGAIRRDKATNRRPICMIGNAGTVATGAVDPLQELAQICREEEIWFHVDGAFGGFAWLSGEHRQVLEGMNQADSLVFDMHKWMYLPFDVSCLLVRDRESLESALRTTAEYMTSTASGPASYPVSFSDRSIEQSRRFRALKVWFSIKTHGIEAFGRAVGRNIQQVQHLAALVRSHEHLELCSSSPLNVACFRYVRAGASEPTLDRINRQILAALQTSGRAVPSHTVLDGKFVIRVANVNHRTEAQDFDYLVDQVLLEGARSSAMLST